MFDARHRQAQTLHLVLAEFGLHAPLPRKIQKLNPVDSTVHVRHLSPLLDTIKQHAEECFIRSFLQKVKSRTSRFNSHRN